MKQLEPEPTVLTTKEVATILRVSEKTVYRMIASKQLTALRIGRLRRVTPSAVAQLVKNLERSERLNALDQTVDKVVR